MFIAVICQQLLNAKSHHSVKGHLMLIVMVFMKRYETDASRDRHESSELNGRMIMMQHAFLCTIATLRCDPDSKFVQQDWKSYFRSE
jgi:hypothetical protein